MKENIFYVAVLLFIASCSNQTSESEMATSSEPESVLLEYMWCNFGPNTSEDALNELVADFNEITKNSDHPVESAWAYVPSFETDNYDAVWLNVWSDEEERNAGWTDWVNDSAADFEAKHNDTLDCQEERLFQFTGTAGMTPGIEWSDEPPFNADFHFCTFNDGKGFDELNRVMKRFDGWVAGREKDSMWYVWHDPLFDTTSINGSVNNGYDYMIGFYWQNSEEREAGYAAYSETNLQSRFDEIESCQILDFEGYPIVQPST